MKQRAGPPSPQRAWWSCTEHAVPAQRHLGERTEQYARKRNDDDDDDAKKKKKKEKMLLGPRAIIFDRNNSSGHKEKVGTLPHRRFGFQVRQKRPLLFQNTFHLTFFSSDTHATCETTLWQIPGDDP